MNEDSSAIMILNRTGEVSRPDLPSLIQAAGASFAWDEFFAGVIRNRHTRTAYLHAVRKFLAWVEPTGCPLERISPGMVGAYFDQHPGSLPTKKLHLAALRAFFDLLVTRHVLLLNPAATVRGERYVAVEGKTPEITREQARTLLNSIDTASPIGRRDKAIIATLIYTAARAGAVANLKLQDFVWDGTQYSLRILEKGGKSRLIPVRYDLQGYLLDYLQSFDWQGEDRKSVLFRSGYGRTGKLTERPLRNIDICRVVKRRLRKAGLPQHLSPHSFRVATVTDLLQQGIPLEDVQYLAGHADPRTTRLYDRRQKSVTRNTVERISI